VREGGFFYYSEFREKFFYSRDIIKKLHKLISSLSQAFSSKTVPISLKNLCPENLNSMVSSFFVPVAVRTVWKSLQKIVPNSHLDFCARKCVMAALECMPISSEIYLLDLLDFCAYKQKYGL
jgi:hypothetical protein